MGKGLFLIHVISKASELLRNKNVKTINEAIDKAFLTKKKQYKTLTSEDKERLNYKDTLTEDDEKYLVKELERTLEWINEDRQSNLKNKKILNIVAREIRKNIKCDFVLSLKIAKIFLNHEEWKEENEDLGFVFDWEWNGEVEDKYFQGKVANYNQKLEYEFTHEMYKLQEKYLSNQK
jgi:flagellar biosynthesis/type III secretory pathway chaperone